MPAFPPLPTPATRPLGATTVDDVLGVDIAPALLIADTLDAVSAAVCRAAGLTDDEARSVLGVLWGTR